MSENPRVQENKSDDIDLITLFEKIFSFFRMYRKSLLIFSIIGIILGFVLYKISPKQYASSLLLHSFTLSNTEQIRIIQNWNELLKNGEYTVLGERLHCNPAILKKVNSISAMEMQKLYISNNPNGFIVNAFVKDNNALDSLGDAIVYGLENVDYIKAKLDSRRFTLKQLIEKVQSEIIKLDSIKENIEYSINNNSQRSSSFIIDVSAINSQVIGLNEKLLGYQDELKFTNSVQVLQKFEKFEKPASPKLFKLLVLGFIGGLGLGYLWSVYSYLRKRIAKRAQA